METKNKRPISLEEAALGLGLSVREPGIFCLAGILIKVIAGDKLEITYLNESTQLPNATFSTRVPFELNIDGKTYLLHSENNVLVIEEVVPVIHFDIPSE